MKNLLSNFEQTRNSAICFLSSRFNGSKLSIADFEDAVSTAFEKLLLDAAKPNPMLTASAKTICYLAQNALIDVYRKRKREILIEEIGVFSPLSMTATDDQLLENKTRMEEAIAEVVYLPQRRRQLIEAKYDARYFDTTASLDDIVQFKNRSKQKNLTQELGFTTEGAMRQEMFRAITTLRLRLCA